MISMIKRWLSLASIAVMAGMSFGCGQSDRPPLGYVAGTVTFQGEPLAGAIVAFMPEKGRPATGLSDSRGEYEIQYQYGVKGCKVGPNTVAFFPGAGLSHPIPDKYTNRPEFEVEVESGNNTFDFDLEADAAAKPKASVLD